MKTGDVVTHPDASGWGVVVSVEEGLVTAAFWLGLYARYVTDLEDYFHAVEAC